VIGTQDKSLSLMGLCTSKKPRTGEPGSTSNASVSSKDSGIGGAYTWESRKQGKDPKDYVVRDMKDAVVIKTKVEGEQFNIENCSNCDIFILDYSAAVFVDVCINCRIYVGPVESSIFIRECTGCSMIIAAQQFRMRECKECSIGLFSQTEPVIEMSKDIRLGCFDFSYFSLAEQCKKAKLNVWCNKWWQVHDFNAEDGASNWSILPSHHTLLEGAKSGLGEEELSLPSSIPFTTGKKATDGGALLFFLPTAQEPKRHNFLALSMFQEQARIKNWELCRTRLYPLRGSEAKALVGKAITDGDTVGVEIAHSEGLFLAVQQYIASLNAGSNVILISQEERETVARTFFETLKDEVF